MPQMISEKYWQESLAAEARAQALQRQSATRQSIVQFLMALVVIGFVVSWKFWLPPLAKATTFVAQFFGFI